MVGDEPVRQLELEGGWKTEKVIMKKYDLIGNGTEWDGIYTWLSI